MEYYVITNKKDNTDKILCRIDGNVFEIYYWDNKSTGEWLKDDKYEKIFNDKDDNYVIETPTDEEIKELKNLIDDYAYEDFHTHYASGDDAIRDSKGRKHDVFIYQDYRSIDGYSVDDGFDYSEVMYREDYDYYYDENNNLLIKKDKDNGKYYIFTMYVNEPDLKKSWSLPKDCDDEIKPIVKNYDFNNSTKIDDIKEVLGYISNLYYKKYDELKTKGYHLSIW